MATLLDPASVAAAFRSELRSEIAALTRESGPLVLAGFLVAEQGPSATYAEYTRKGCDDVGVRFDLRRVPRLEVEAAIRAANVDPGVHGILVYYPVFGTGQDNYLRELVDPSKDIEGLHPFWARCLYENRRFLDDAYTKKAILPCTPLAILKLLDAAAVSKPGASAVRAASPGALSTSAASPGAPSTSAASPGAVRPLWGKKICVFNRSEVVGRPLASMLANDGAEVVSFDLDGAQLFVSAPNATSMVPGPMTGAVDSLAGATRAAQGAAGRTDGSMASPPPAKHGGHTVRETRIDRATALAQADVVITGVPGGSFALITPDEIREGAVCVSFSTARNYRDDIVDRASVFVPRVGPMTVTMALRNAVRLYKNSR